MLLALRLFFFLAFVLFRFVPIDFLLLEMSSSSLSSSSSLGGSSSGSTMAGTSTSGNRGASRRSSPECAVEATAGSGVEKNMLSAWPMVEEETEVVELDDGSGEPSGGSSMGKAADEEIADSGANLGAA